VHLQLSSREPSPRLQASRKSSWPGPVLYAQQKIKCSIYTEKLVQVLDFFGLKDDMHVTEILPFGGWYSKILGPVLGDDGQLYSTQPELGSYSDAIDPTLALPGMDRVSKPDYNIREKNTP